VEGFPGALFRGFERLEDARAWLRDVAAAFPDLAPALADLLDAPGEETAEEILRSGTVLIYTDGGSIGNPGPGGYGAILRFGKHRRELSGGYRRTTNNRMELMACIQALEALRFACPVVLYSDSRYVVDGIVEGWAERWRANEWWRTKKERAENVDLWSRLLALCEEHEVEFRWLKGHAGNPDNERCDALAQQAARRDDLPPDEAYEAGEIHTP
jgi:ribonuclease HI